MSDVSALTAALADRYRIERELGTGGMATVYLARDLKHDRQVALKVLKPELAAVVGAERFLVEIKTTANLQHPHILALFDSGAVDGTLFYAMPFVDGESLRDRLTRETQLPIGDAVRLAGEVADALAYAHARGVIHRDIKPENILLQGGHALVADFGIALAVQSLGGQRMTETGLSLGTPQYMSPEQATAERTIDARSDIYALAAVTYEMLTGEPPFHGATAQRTIAKLLTENASPPSAVRDTVPAALDEAILTALAKLPADRFATASEFGAAIVRSGTTTAVRGHAAVKHSRAFAVWVGAGVVAASVAAFIAGRTTRDRSEISTERFGRAIKVTWEPGLKITPAISPDGKLVAYAASDGTLSKIYVRPVAGGRAVKLTDDSMAVEQQPHWSRDGSRILFMADGTVFSAPSGGGPPHQEVPQRSGEVESAVWSPDEREIAFVVGDTLFVREANGSSRKLATMYQPTLCAWGSQNLIACAVGNPWYLKPGLTFGNEAPSWITVIDVASGRTTIVSDSTSGNESPQWTSDGRTLLYVSNRLGPPDLYAVRVTGQGAASGAPLRLTVGLDVNSFSLSADGSRIAYSVLTANSNVWSQPWSEQPSAAPSAPPTQLTFGQQTIEGIAVSRDGQWLYYDSNLAGNADIYRLRLPSGQPERVTSDPTVEFDPDPSPDGRSVAFHSWRTGSRDIFVLPLDGGPVEQVTHTPLQEQNARWSPDGRTLSFTLQSTPSALFLAKRDAEGKWQTRQRVGEGYWANWSADSRYLSYVTSLYGGGLRVVAAGDSAAPRRVYDESVPGAPLAETTAWSDDGRTIFFKSHSTRGIVSIWSVPFSGGTPRRIIDLGDARLRSDRYGFRISHGRIFYALFDRQSSILVMELNR